jgi:hypothetical protein
MVVLSGVALQLAYERDIADGTVKQLLLRVENGHHWFESKWVGKGTNTTHTALAIVVGFALLLFAPLAQRVLAREVTPQEAQIMVKDAMEDGISAVMKLMAEEADDRNITIEACSTILDEVFLDEQAQEEFGAAGLCPYVLAALSRAPSDTAVLSSGITLMGRLSKQKKNAKAFGREGCEVVVNALLKFPEHEVISMGGIDAMLHLSSGFTMNLWHLYKLDALAVVDAAKSRWPELAEPAETLLVMLREEEAKASKGKQPQTSGKLERDEGGQPNVPPNAKGGQGMNGREKRKTK